MPSLAATAEMIDVPTAESLVILAMGGDSAAWRCCTARAEATSAH